MCRSIPNIHERQNSLRSTMKVARLESATTRPATRQVPPKHSHRLNEADRLRLVAEYLAGSTREELVRTYGVGKDTVTRAVLDSGQRMRRARITDHRSPTNSHPKSKHCWPLSHGDCERDRHQSDLRAPRTQQTNLHRLAAARKHELQTRASGCDGYEYGMCRPFDPPSAA